MPNVLSFRPLDPDLPVLFTHVPKTGGSSITGGMASLFGRDNIAGISTAVPEKRRAFLEECRTSSKRYVYGHFRYEDAEPLYERANFIVSLRHPLDRILSFYFMMLREGSAFAQECAKDVSGKGFLHFHDRLVRLRRQDNLMCRYICGEPDYQKSVDNLQSSYCLAWDSESTVAAWHALHLGLTGREPKAQNLPKRNHAPVAAGAADFTSGARPKDYGTFLPPQSAEVVREINSEDIRLFEWFQAEARKSSVAGGTVPKSTRRRPPVEGRVSEEARGAH
jgi:hypothetical protein